MTKDGFNLSTRASLSLIPVERRERARPIFMDDSAAFVRLLETPREKSRLQHVVRFITESARRHPQLQQHLAQRRVSLRPGGGGAVKDGKVSRLTFARFIINSSS